MNHTAIPVTLLTGFLGAGKTTVLRRLLSAPHGERIVVIENEFGEVGIDGDLLKGTTTTIVELSNGCICCSVRGALNDALTSLLAQRDAGTLAFERVVIETTGLADPAPIVQSFFWDEALRERFQLDGVITLIDAVHFDSQYANERVLASQVAFADRLLISRADLVSAENLSALRARLHFINARAPVANAACAGEQWSELFHIGGFRLDERGLPAAGWRNSTAQVRAMSGKRSFDHSVCSIVLEQGAPLRLDAVSAFVDALLAEHALDLLRYKGILSIAGEARRLIFQGVHRIAGFDYGRNWEADETRSSRIVLIGRSLPQDSMRERFAATVAEYAY